jgi:RHS repeat-associated protein
MKRGHRMNWRICAALFILFSLFLYNFSFASAISSYSNLTYDGNGNLITGDGKYREYNEFNKLIRVREGNSASGDILESYVYDPTSDRIITKYTDYSGGGSSNNGTNHGAVVYVNDNFERVYTDIISAPKINDTYYARDENGIIGEIKTDGITTKKLYYHPDHLGSTSLITNDSGGVVENIFYDPYGEMLDPYGAILLQGTTSRYQYEGKEFSYVTEDYDYNFRKYSPQLGIFTQPEQLFPNVYDPQQLNRYSFERRNPYRYTDPNGKSIVAVGIIGFLIGASYYMMNTPIDENNARWERVWKAEVMGAVAVPIAILSYGYIMEGGALRLSASSSSIYSRVQGASLAGSFEALRQAIAEQPSFNPSPVVSNVIGGFLAPVRYFGGGQFVGASMFTWQSLRAALFTIYSNVAGDIVSSVASYALDKSVYRDQYGQGYSGVPNKQTSGGTETKSGGTGGNNGGGSISDPSDFGKPKNPRCGWGMSCA